MWPADNRKSAEPGFARAKLTMCESARTEKEGVHGGTMGGKWLFSVETGAASHPTRGVGLLQSGE